MISMTLPQYRRCECTSASGLIVKLTRREADTLAILLIRQGHVVSYSEIISHIWPDPDFEPDYAKATVKIYVHRLRAKLGMDAIDTIRGSGCIIRKPYP